MRILNKLPKIFTTASAVMLSLSLSVLTVFCVSDETRSSPETAMTGGDGNLSIIIGIILIAIGLVGFAVLKIKERGKS